MKKIPTLFQRDPENMKRVLPVVTPGCEWVLAGEGQATRKIDGTCTMFDGTSWWARREVKQGKNQPANFIPVDHDLNTGKTVGWEPIEQSGFAKWHAEAIDNDDEFAPGTYELCGPKINGNPENLLTHILIPHGKEPVLIIAPLNYERLRDVVTKLGQMGYEGLVWHHPDGRMAKLKARDFPKENQ